jgi:Tol biopolymer transport system component
LTEATPEAPEMRFEMPAPGVIERPAISPDGQRIAYVAANEGKQLIWIRPIGSLTARALPGTDNAAGIFWAPDSRYLAYSANGK